MQTSGIVNNRPAIRVEITGYRCPNKDLPPPGTIGYLEPHELSIHGDIINALFYPIHPDGSHSGYGQVTWPLYKSVHK